MEPDLSIAGARPWPARISGQAGKADDGGDRARRGPGPVDGMTTSAWPAAAAHAGAAGHGAAGHGAAAAPARPAVPGMTAAHVGPALPGAAVPGAAAVPAAGGRTADAAGLRVPPFAARWAGRLAGEWPLHSYLELGALDGAVPSARLHARHLLREWGLAALAGDAELVVSELVTNAVQASRAMAHAAIRLWLASDRTQALICVWDASPRPPARMDPAADAENGRGLLLVEAVSAQWGWFPAAPGSQPAGDHHGKAVWAIVR
jgi:anti-sigma regulatory factor (Ser/Thr protein kinase)